MSTYTNKYVPSGFQIPDNFSFKFFSLKVRFLYVLYMYFFFYHILENLTSFVKFATQYAFQIELPFFNHNSVSQTITYQMSHQLWLQIMLFGNSQSPTATELYMLITRRFFFRAVKFFASSRHNSIPITDEHSNSVFYSYMYTICDGCVVAALHNVTS